MSDGDERNRPETTPLDYQVPASTSRGNPGMVIVGVLAGGALWLGIGVAIGTSIWTPVPSRSAGSGKYWAVSFMFIVVLSAIGLVARARTRRFFWVGFLIGSAIMALFQGICFSTL